MANNFKIVISATDKSTATIRKVNNEISRMTRPLVDVQRSAKALGAELGRNPAVKVLGKITNVAAGAVAGLAKLAVPMAALTGVASIAGVATLATHWGNLGFEIGKTSSLLGVTTSNLQSLRGAAELAGVSSESLTSGLGNVRQTLQDAKWGRNQPVVGLMNRLNIEFHKTADGSVDAARGLMDIADAIAAQKDLGAKHTIAQAFGVSELLPMLMKGRKGIEEYQRRAAELAGFRGPQAIRDAEEFGRKLIELRTAASGLKVEIGSALMPVMKPLIEQFTTWIALNREDIGSAVSDGLNKMVKWFKETDFSLITDNLYNIGEAVVWLVDKLGTLVTVIGKLGNLKAALPGIWRFAAWSMSGWGGDSPGGPQRSSGGLITPPASTAPGSGPLGIRNNNPGNLRQWGAMPTEGGFAVFPNATAGIAAMGKQLQMYGNRGINTVRGVVSTWAPPSENDTGAYIDSVVKQTGFAPDQKLNLNDSKTLTPLISSMIKQENGQNPYSKEMIEGAIAQTVTVEFKNAPPGTSATAKTKSGADVPVRINHSLPTLAAG